jgi:hypothetical protein
MDAAISRLSNIAERTEARIRIVESEGAGVSKARTALTEANAKLAEARTRLATASKNAEEALLSDTPVRDFAPVREEFRVVRDMIREAFILLRTSLAELRDATIEQALNTEAMTAASLSGVTRSNVETE